MSEENIKNEFQSVDIAVLLPCCVEQDTDIFLSILKGVIWRTKLDDENIEALKAGMTENMFYVKSNDLLAHWKELSSKSQRVRQFKLLGYWIARNFPTLGQKLLGDAWQATPETQVEIIGNVLMSAVEIEDAIFRKMQIRIITMNVSFSTLDKLKHFVKVPTSIGTFNGKKISRKLTSYEIIVDHTERCWAALKCGKFSTDEVRFLKIVFLFYN